jgi:predicted ester cyclase
VSFVACRCAATQDRLRAADRTAAEQRAQEATMSQEQDRNKRIVQRLYQEVGNEGRLEVLDEITWPDHVEHYPFPGQAQGVEGLKQRISMVRAVLNPTFTIEHLIAGGDKVAVMWSNRCEHVGEWLGFSPTGEERDLSRGGHPLLRDGRLAEHWDVVDISGFLVAVGAMPGPAVGAQR